MLDTSSLILFFIAGSGLLITPGPAVLYIVARSIQQGKLAGIISALGIATGTVFHVVAAALGISAILMSSALAFNIVKYAGAAYLIFLGIKAFLSPNNNETPDIVEKKKLSKIYYQGVLVNLLNPKTALFFFAFLPQFVNNLEGSVAVQIIFLGFLFILMGIISDGAYALLAGTVGNWLKNNLHYIRYQKYFSGSIYIALGIFTAISGSNKK